ncbi:MAG: 4Fe-4S binding protein [Dehalococcoidales bacterium]|nr:4Fe-4S binding protein [Dehalococcoidales bacterium]
MEKTASPKVLVRSRTNKGFLKLDLVTTRNLIQAALAMILLYTGWRFYLFVQHFETLGSTPYVERPASVEAFLPLSALVATKNWIVNGTFDTIHPAGLTIFLAVTTISLLFKKAVCSWLCPIGALSELLAKLGKHILSRNLRLPTYFDRPLMGLKYLVLGFFVKSIIIDIQQDRRG